MLLRAEDAELFFKLQRALMYFVNQQLGVVPNIASVKEFARLSPEARVEVRDAFLDRLDLIEPFVAENPENFSDDEMDIVLSWRRQVSGTFYVFRQLKKYMVFLSSTDPVVAYGVVALTEPFEDLVSPYLPVMTQTVLLPFKDQIVYDGLLGGYNISFGGGIKRMLNDSYRLAKQRQGIVTSLPIESLPISAATAKMTPVKTTTVKKKPTKKKRKPKKTSIWRIDDDNTISTSDQIYQFKITLKHTKPAIWRRIQVKDCSLDELHRHIQAAMGWTNMHLHQFEIDGESYGDPGLLNDGFSDFDCADSTVISLSQIVPKDGRRFRFLYEYDFGDGWEHEILFEGFSSAESGKRYPICVKGSRACPPEDVGGVWGYQEYLAALADPDHQQHDELLEWNGPFNPNAFNALATTKYMRQGLPAWR